jgi:hypothetical protein
MLATVALPLLLAVSPIRPIAEDAGSKDPKPITTCPASEPKEGDTCSGFATRCVYAPRPECGTVWDCYVGKWHLRAKADCTKKAGTCPSSSKAAPRNPPQELVCIYPDGQVCGFWPEIRQPPCSGVPTYQPPPSPPRFACRTLGSPTCETSREAGAPCEPEGAFCGAQCCGNNATCVKGKWKPGFAPCPPSTRGR